MKQDDINILAMIKGEERYVFLYNEVNRTEMLRTLGRYAADPQLSFSWFDAAVLSKKVREIAYDEMVAQSIDQEAVAESSGYPRFSIQHEEDII